MEAEVLYHPARMVSRSPAGGGMTLVAIEPDRRVAASYTSPGQYVEVRIEGQTGYFVLASVPGLRPWELVMRAGGGASDVLLAGRIDVDLEVTAALGDGFPMEAARGRPLLIALSGTGVAGGRALVRHRIADGDGPLTQVWLGVRTHAELPLASDLEAWRGANVPVVVCVSQPGDALPAGELVYRGYVQDVIAARVPAGALTDAYVFAVGVTSMVDALRVLAPRLGMAPDRVRTNH
jgi:NAD(P)H-flavin reductase